MGGARPSCRAWPLCRRDGVCTEDRGHRPAGTRAHRLGHLKLKLPIEKLGSTGAAIAAAACPVCFPKLALLGALLGLGGLGAYESQFFMAAQALVAVAVAGHLLSFRAHRNRWILGAAIASAAAVVAGLYLLGSELLAYAGFAGLICASIPEL